MDEVRFRNPVKDIGFAQIEHIMTLDPKLSDGAFRTFALYLKYAHQRGRCWPSRERMARERGKTERALQYHNNELVRLGYITREQRIGQTYLTIIEDVQAIPRLKELAKAELIQREINCSPREKKIAPLESNKLPTEEESGKKKQGRKKKARVDAGSATPRSEAVDVYREETHYFPPKSWWTDLEAVEDLEFWRKVVHAYVGLGWNKRNVQGMLEWYQRGEIPRVTKGGKSAPSIGRPSAPASQSTIEAFRAARARRKRDPDVEGTRPGTGTEG